MEGREGEGEKDGEKRGERGERWRKGDGEKERGRGGEVCENRSRERIRGGKEK